MRFPFFVRTRGRVLVGLSLLVLLGSILVLPTRTLRSVKAQQPTGPSQPGVPNIPPGSAYRQTNLISDSPGMANVLDPLLVNPWGMTVRGTSPFWVANNGTSTTQLIRDPNGAGPVVLNPSPQTITIPGGLPTGTVGNSTSDFQLTPPGGGSPAASNFIFCSLTGQLTAWNGASGTTAQNVVSMPGHVWTGLAIGASTTPAGNRLYAADFANNHIDVFDGTFTATTVTGGFVDVTVPTTHHVYNIQNLGGSLYVTYAKYAISGNVVNGLGEGYVRKFNTDGTRDVGFTINSGALNAPWGLAIAPASFGVFGGALLVGNFAPINNSPGPASNPPIPSINAYNPSTGASLFPGPLQDESGAFISIDKLWALQFGNGGNGGDVNTLYFTAGPAAEEHGLFGSIKPTTATAKTLIQFPSEDQFTEEIAVSEGTGHVDVTVARTGDTSGTSTINVATIDASQPGRASQKSDYEIALGKLTFNPGDTSKTLRILVVDDKFVEGDELINVVLSNPTGTGTGLGFPNVARVRIVDNDSVPPTTNPADDSSFFVRQHYLDFLNREPDPAGLAFWINNIDSCAGNTQCRETKRIDTSAAFFLSQEFQKTGVLAYLTHRAAFGSSAAGAPTPILYGNFMRDTQALQQNLVFGQPGFDAQLEANKVAYYNEFVTRPEFVSKYPSTLTNDQYVDNLLASANLTPAEVRRFTVSLTNAQEVPPATPTTSTGAARPASSGTAVFQFNSGQTAMSFTATISNIDVGGQTADINDDLTAAHIHAGASVAPGVNGPVVWGFFGAPFNDNNPNDQVFFPTIGGVGGTFRGKWDAPEGNGTTLAAQLSNLRQGRAYINFHTKQFGGGEIRGNFPAENAFRDSLVAGLNGSTLTRAQVLRAIAESDELNTREFNAAFVAMEYFGYLRRDADTSGYNFWLNKLNAAGGSFQNAEMVKGFISSSEYRQRFGV